MATFTLQPYFPEGAGSYATVSYTLTGGTTDLSIPFPYLGQEDYTGSSTTKSNQIKVFVGNVELTGGWHMPDNSTVRTSSAFGTAADPVTVTIRRYTDLAIRQVDYQSGSTLKERILDRDKLEDFYKLQETIDRLYEIWAYVGTPAYIKHFTRTADGTTTTWTLYDDSGNFEEDIVSEAEILVRVGGSPLLPENYTLDKDSEGYVTVELAEAPPSGVKLGFTTLTSGDPQALNVELQIPDNSITADKLANPLITRDTWSLLVSIDEGTYEDAVDGDVLIWDADSGGTTALTQRPLNHDDIPDFDAGVRTNRLDQMAAPTSDVSMNSNKITNLTPGVASTDAATVGQVSTSDNFQTNTTIPEASFPATLKSGLTEGTWLVMLACEGHDDGGGASYTVQMDCEGIALTQTVSNHPDGTSQFCFFFVVTVAADGLVEVGSSTSKVKAVHFSAGVRLA